ncbi:MAG TPA: class I SAM-dependent methyltransferase [Chryseolinea sp.]|nr:class I SAM-dependent methyltransferase [Chryseolinea sp.]
MTAKDHYAHHLAHFYSWMVGDFSEKQLIQEDFFIRNEITPKFNNLAIDLGAGNGLQSVSLAKLGFEVIAVDFNKQLLDELTINKKDLNVTIVCDDAINFLKHFERNADAIVCMGDTITHLESNDHVEELLVKISDRLNPEGKLVISFRELIAELNGAQRFIPVRSDETRILTCFLEYFPNHVIVHDILHEWQSGTWIQKVSSYPKLRLSESYITTILERSNIKVLFTQRLSGMIYLVGEKASVKASLF